MSEVRPAAVIILAAGEGRRMKSRTPKVLHALCGRSMLGHVLSAAAGLDPGCLVVVVGQGRDQVIPHIGELAPGARVVEQPRQEGTGNAVRVALESAGQIPGLVVVTYADTPLLRTQTLAHLIATHRAESNAVTTLAARVPDPAGYGRIVRGGDGGLSKIVEDADATAAERAIDEINSGVYAFDGDLLADAVKRVATDNAKGEEYLTDVVAIMRAEGHRAGVALAADPAEIAGVNDRVQLAAARRVLNSRIVTGWMRAGVTVVDPATTWIDVDVMLEPDVVIGPGTQLEGRTAVARGARVGPGCVLADTVVGKGALVTYSVCVRARVGAGAIVGPFARLGKGAVSMSAGGEGALPGEESQISGGTAASEGAQSG